MIIQSTNPKHAAKIAHTIWVLVFRAFFGSADDKRPKVPVMIINIPLTVYRVACKNAWTIQPATPNTAITTPKTTWKNPKGKINFSITIYANEGLRDSKAILTLHAKG